MCSSGVRANGLLTPSHHPHTCLRSLRSRPPPPQFFIIMSGTTKATHTELLDLASGEVGGKGEQIVGLYSSGDWMNEDAIKQKRNYPVDLTAVSDNCMALVCDVTGFEYMLEQGG